MDKIEDFERILERATENVRPPNYMIRFYNFIGKLPMKLGLIIFILTGIDTVKVASLALRGRTDAAIQVLYRYQFRPWRLFWGLGDHLWQSAYNCRSVRSRGVFTREIIKFLLRKKVSENGSQNKELRVASLGSGSASQILQGVSENHLNGKRIRLSLIDNDFRALKLGQKNAKKIGIESITETREETVGMFLKEEEENFDFIEMVGLSDYFNNKRLSSYFSGIHSILRSKGGYFLGANISSREEADYAHGVACWPKMYYRGREEIISLLKDAGFEEIWIGKCGLYLFWIAQKV